MPITARENSGPTRDPVPEGVHVAVAYGLLDLGTHHDERYDKDTHRVVVLYELPDCKYTFTDKETSEKKEAPHVLSQTFTLSLGERANLRKTLEAWRGKKFTAEELAGFDLCNILGKACQLQVLHNESGGKTYANIESVMALPKGTKAPKAQHEQVYFSFEDSEEIPEHCPNWCKELITSSQEWENKSDLEDLPDSIFDEKDEGDTSEIPF